MLYKVTHCAGHGSANARLHQLRWGDYAYLHWCYVHCPNFFLAVFPGFDWHCLHPLHGNRVLKVLVVFSLYIFLISPTTHSFQFSLLPKSSAHPFASTIFTVVSLWDPPCNRPPFKTFAQSKCVI